MSVKWEYQDSRGAWREGVFEKCVEGTGDDFTYFFRRDDGTLDECSSDDLKTAHPIIATQGQRWPDRNPAEAKARGNAMNHQEEIDNLIRDFEKELGKRK